MRPDLPDLPELESTQTRDLSLLPLLMVFGIAILGLGGMVICAYAKYSRFIPLRQSLLIALVPALLLYAIVRFLAGYYRYGTNQDGVWLQGLFRRRMVRWESIRSAEMRTNRTGEPSLVIQTEKGRAVIPRRGMASSYAGGDTVFASVWQHLRRRGVNGFEPTGSMLSLWAPIPDDIPDDVEVGEEPTGIKQAGAILALSSVPALCAILALTSATSGAPAMLQSVFIGSLGWRVFPETLRKAHRLRVSKDGLDATLVFRKLFIPWSEVSAAYWQGMSLIVRGKEPGSVVNIEYKPGNRESEYAILSTIGHIRRSSNPQPLIVPGLLPRNPAELQKPASSSTVGVYMRRAYLNTLVEPARKRVSLCANIVVIATMFGVCAAFAAMLTDVVGRLTVHLHGQGATMIIPAASVAVVLPLFMCGLGISTAVGNVIARRIAGEYIEEFRTYGRVGRTSSADAKLMKAMTALGLAGVLLLTPLSVDCYAKLTDKAVIVNGFWETRERTYTWDNVLAITPIYGGHRSVSYRMSFRDGSEWTLNPNGSVLFPQPEIDRVAGLIAARINTRR